MSEFGQNHPRVKGVDLARAYAQSDSLTCFSSAITALFGRTIIFRNDGTLTDEQSLAGLEQELAEMIVLFAAKLAQDHQPDAIGIAALLQDLASLKRLTRSAVQDRLGHLGLAWPGKLILVTLHPADQHKAIPESMAALMRQLAGSDWVWSQKDDLHTLFHDETLAGWISSGQAAVRAAAAEIPLAGCVSDEFYDLMHLPSVCQANTRIAGIIEQITRQPALVDYDQFKQADLILTAASAPDFDYRQYVCRPVTAIFDYDRRHGTDFLYTLYCFLTSASSFVVTARKMHLHKNTVDYRIHRMQKLFELDLETIESKFDMIFSCYILRIFGET